MPATNQPWDRRLLTLLPFAAAWSIALIVVGVIYGDAVWSPVTVGAGILCLVQVALGFALRRWIGPLYGVLCVTAILMGVIGAMIRSVEFVSLGVFALIVIGATASIAMAFVDRGPGKSVESTETSDLLRRLLEHSMLSDGAKRLLFRERELGMLRDLIETDIVEGKYNAALTLCHEMAERFGYREEAEAFRSRINEAREAHYETEIHHAIGRLDDQLAARNWAQAHEEAARIRRLYGDSHLVADLDERILRARGEHKAELERCFVEAAQRDDVEGAMQLLKELDRYLEPTDAERLAEVAQGVVVKHRDNLGVQFKLAVNDHRWAEAARIGQTIMDEFPNTKMADEVRSMVDVLRTRATQSALTGGGR